MAHLVETMAYAGATPWHKLGNAVSNDHVDDSKCVHGRNTEGRWGPRFLSDPLAGKGRAGLRQTQSAGPAASQKTGGVILSSCLHLSRYATLQSCRKNRRSAGPAHRPAIQAGEAGQRVQRCLAAGVAARPSPLLRCVRILQPARIARRSKRSEVMSNTKITGIAISLLDDGAYQATVAAGVETTTATVSTLAAALQFVQRVSTESADAA